MENSEKLRDSVFTILEQQDRIQRLVDAATVPKLEISSPALDALKEITDNSAVRILQENSAAMNALTENSRAMQALTGADSAIQALQKNSMVHTIGELAIKSAMPSYQFESPELRSFENWSNRIESNEL